VVIGPGLRLLLCGAAALYWELVLIRWTSSCVRIVAYYSNSILIASFFGLGVGALLARRPWRLERLAIPALALAVLVALALAGFEHPNPENPDEFVWIGTPFGVQRLQAPAAALSVVLPLVYLTTALVFVVFGQWIGRLFGELPPLRAYSIEVSGSLAGILLFALLSRLGAGPPAWFSVGLVLVVAGLPRGRASYALAVVGALAILVPTIPFARQFVWSPYYRIYSAPLLSIVDRERRRPVQLQPGMGYTISVNNDYHQMLLDLRPRADEHAFFKAWRALYELPYLDDAKLPPGPILVVGAGTGNDTAAALRRTRRRIVAVEIDPQIAALGKRLHPERPYDDPRVTLRIGDARTTFQTTSERFALVVFGFLDSHTLLSSFSSVRLENFVYTRESLEHVRRILRPGGKVAITFASNRNWIHQRMVALLNEVFARRTLLAREQHRPAYTNGIVYQSYRLPPETSGDAGSVIVPDDDWPFLYLRSLALVVLLALGSLLLLPRGERRLRLPYFFLGAAFFLLETGNVVSLSLLYGSTWIVNVVVFGGILLLVLLGNLTCSRAESRDLLMPAFVLLVASLALSLLLRPAMLLQIEQPLLRGAAAVAVFLGPVYFAAIIFARLIRNEQHLAAAYGSNLLGTMVGGASEYLSMLLGFRFLGALVLLFYGVVFLLLARGRALRD
jgi:SAM-dependent methyltransferase